MAGIGSGVPGRSIAACDSWVAQLGETDNPWVSRSGHKNSPTPPQKTKHYFTCLCSPSSSLRLVSLSFSFFFYFHNPRAIPHLFRTSSSHLSLSQASPVAAYTWPEWTQDCQQDPSVCPLGLARIHNSEHNTEYRAAFKRFHMNKRAAAQEGDKLLKLS